MCGAQIPSAWCGQRISARPTAWAELLAPGDGRPLGGVTFFRARGDTLDFRAQLDGLQEGDYKMVLDDARACAALSAAAPSEPLRLRFELVLAAFNVERDGTASLGGSLQGMAPPARGMVALAVRGGDLTELTVAPEAVVACGRIDSR